MSIRRVEWLTPNPERSHRLRRAQRLARVGAWLAHLGIPRACLALLIGGAPSAPRRFSRLFGQTAAQTLARLVGEVRKLPPEVHPLMQEFWSQPKCYRAMADHLAALELDAAAIARIETPASIPTIVISSGNQPEEQIDAQRRLAEASRGGCHVIAARIRIGCSSTSRDLSSKPSASSWIEQPTHWQRLSILRTSQTGHAQPETCSVAGTTDRVRGCGADSPHWTISATGS